MTKMINLSSSTKIYLFLLSICLFAGILFLIAEDKGDLVIILNNSHSPLLDKFFKYMTFLGDGTWFAPIIVLFLFFRYFWSAAFAVLGLVQLLIIQGMKRVIFGRIPRPAEYFKDSFELQMVEGVDIHNFYSFPSGHTATAFGISFMIILLVKPRRGISVALLILATLAGISRIYLGQHFLEDVLAGAAIGTFLSFCVWKLFDLIESKYSNSAFFLSSLGQRLGIKN